MQCTPDAWETFCNDLTPDAYNAPTIVVPGKILDILDFKLGQWPGHGVAEHSEYQYVEKEYMKADEYPDLIDDPSGFFMNRFFPRIFGTLEPLPNMPLLPPVNEIPCIPPALFPFGDEDLQAAFSSLAKAGEEAIRWRDAVRRLNGKIMGQGYPDFFRRIHQSTF